MKKEIKIKELKKEFSEQEAEKLAANLLKNLDSIYISQGATPIEKAKAKRAGTVEAVDYLFGLPYVSNSVEGTAAALWNTNTSAELLGADVFRFLGVAVGNGGEFVGLFQEHDQSGAEVGKVRCLVLDYLGEFVREYNERKHEAERVQKLANLNEFRATIRECLPKVCQILEKYRGKRWGEATKEKIRAELHDLTTKPGGVSVSFSCGSYWLDVNFYKGFAYNSGISFSWKWDEENNTPAEEITPSDDQLKIIAEIEIKSHRQKIGGIIEEIEKTAEKLGQLIEAYKNEARGKGYKAADNLSKWGVNLPDLTRRELDA